MGVVMEVRGPRWRIPGLGQRGERYPLAVEAPVGSPVDTLVPGVSTRTRAGRSCAWPRSPWPLCHFGTTTNAKPTVPTGSAH
ncbi:hypothetical protein GCM10027184_44840 [Saccharothrix stipae]